MHAIFYRRKPRIGDSFYVLTTTTDGGKTIKLLSGIEGAKELRIERCSFVHDDKEADSIVAEMIHHLVAHGWIPTTGFKA